MNFDENNNNNNLILKSIIAGIYRVKQNILQGQWKSQNSVRKLGKKQGKTKLHFCGNPAIKKIICQTFLILTIIIK